MSQCQKKRSDGSRCKANALRGERYCFWHSRKTQKQRDTARKKGGHNRQRKVLSGDTKDLPLKSSSDVATFLERTIHQTIKGQLDCKISNAVGFLCGHLLRALDCDLETRVEALEDTLENMMDEPKVNGFSQ